VWDWSVSGGWAPLVQGEYRGEKGCDNNKNNITTIIIIIIIIICHSVVYTQRKTFQPII
jgi:hypothetical protein